MKYLRLAIFADLSNLYFCSKDRLNGRLNYKYLLSQIVKRNNLIRALAYGVETPDNKPFKEALISYGWELRMKQAKTFSDGQRKADQDIALVMDIVRHISLIDKVVICTGDGDYAPAVQWCKEQGRQVEIFGINISHELRAVADLCVEIKENFLEKGHETTHRLELSTHGNGNAVGNPS